MDEIQHRLHWADALDSAERELLESLPDTFILGASRFVAYKGLEKVIEGGSSVKLPVVIAGSGPGERELRRYAQTVSVPVTFIIRPSTALLYALYQRALVFVFPPIEDFGIMPVEAMATGTPVIVSTVGGTTESVVSGESGMHVDRWTGAEFAAAVDAASRLRGVGPATQARLFSESVFREQTTEWMRSD
ncbi:glycosyltransferase [Rhodococcus sp. NPDC057014]|uniref:glycosyltransferase n=1 Tax=Rhodococcus sp. NPDC057014 TaxID=3346000 RepID=UPI00362BEFFC